MVIVIRCFKGATYVDRFNNMYRAKTTFVIRQTHSVRAIISLDASCLYRANVVEAATDGCKYHPPTSINLKRKDLI